MWKQRRRPKTKCRACQHFQAEQRNKSSECGKRKPGRSDVKKLTEEENMLREAEKGGDREGKMGFGTMEVVGDDGQRYHTRC